ncbi:MAG: S-layer homology domain-containing protein [Clostridia bacterium]|nr:S-layer homology domain-containing protein [Clostridia bacterium]
MKKLTAIILTFGLLINLMVNVSASNEINDNDLLEKFQSLGCIWEEDDGEYNIDEIMTRGKFASLLSKINKNSLSYTNNATSDMNNFFDKDDDLTNFYYNDVQSAVSSGLMSVYDDGKFAPNKPVKLDDVIYSFVNLLGYSKMAEMEGAYPTGYRKKADDLKLLSGIKCSFGSFVTQSDMVKILNNAVDCDVMNAEYVNGKWNYSAKKGKTILTEAFDIYKVKGIITANEFGTILGENGVGKGEVVIDGITFESGKSGAEFLLGYNVKAYYIEGDYENTLCYLEVINNDELFVFAEDIESFENRTLSYNVENKIKKAVISQDVKVIYNGVAIPEYENKDFMPETGDITLLKSGNSVYYDIAIIMSYENYFIREIDFEKCSLTDAYKRTLCWENIENVRIYDEHYNALGSDDLSVNSVVSVAKSKNDTLITFMSASKKTDGRITSVNTYDNKTYVIIDGKNYIADKYYNNDKSDLVIGAEGKFYFDIDGKIVYFEAQNFGTWIPAYSIKGYMNDNEKFTIKLFDGELKDIPIADTVQVDGRKIKNNTIFMSVFESEKLFLYKTNGSGEISYIDYPSDGEPVGNENKNSLRMMNKITAKTWYRQAANCFERVFIANENTKVFVLPRDKSDKTGYVLTDMSVFTNNTYMGITGYCIGGECESAKYIVYDLEQDQSQVLNDTAYYVISSIDKELNEFDEVVDVIRYYDAGAKLNSIVVDEAVDISMLDSGDIIQMSTRNGKVSAVIAVFDYSKKEYGNYKKQNVKGEYVSAYKRIGKTVFLSNGSAIVPDIYKLETVSLSCPIYIFNTKNKTMENGDITDIIDYERSSTDYTNFFMRISNTAEFVIIWK